MQLQPVAFSITAGDALKKKLNIVKRAMDITATGLALIVLAPVFLVIATAIKFTLKGPVFFHQTNMLLGDGAH